MRMAVRPAKQTAVNRSALTRKRFQPIGSSPRTPMRRHAARSTGPSTRRAGVRRPSITFTR